MRARRRYIRRIRLDRARTVALIADTDNGNWSGLTFFERERQDLSGLRTGLRVHSSADVE